ncbi:hypothetical protein [Streptomyces sp. NPDC051546]|uniref:hypothetical protein n=1 Tax=Streptomyces sp. NPDC051546 TaxID=3365655 RepID=UPI00379B275B
MAEQASLQPSCTDRGATGKDAETTIQALLGNHELRRLSKRISREEIRLGGELSPRYEIRRERHDRAMREGDHCVLQRTCPGKHGRWGRICVLEAGHETSDPHWGVTADGRAVAWIGNAPDD